MPGMLGNQGQEGNVGVGTGKEVTEREALAQMDRCPSFAQCGCPLCPLDPLYHRRVGLPGEPSCTLRRAAREALAIGLRTPFAGRTAAETAKDARRAVSLARWTALPEEQQDVVRARLRAGRALLPRAARGNSTSEAPGTNPPG